MLREGVEGSRRACERVQKCVYIALIRCSWQHKSLPSAGGGVDVHL